MRKLNQCTGFKWDGDNFDKHLIRYGVTPLECEEVFFNHPLPASKDSAHSSSEKRYYCLGHTDSGRLLFISFAIRGRNIRIISAREMGHPEERSYFSS
ncbi:MAG: BrnT family toxin [Chitinivibrionales bacterium]|nr:BrnT family toxin [Chitinivibrionales bacterium]